MSATYTYTPSGSGVVSNTVKINGLRTHYLEAGSGPAVVLIHGGEFGACAEISWADLMPPLAAAGYRVIAPDLLGFGGSAKIYDFELGYRRLLLHLGATLEHLGVGPAHVVGTSMGGSLLIRLMTEEFPGFDIRSGSLLGAGGPMPDNAGVRALLGYDGTEDGMRKVVELLYHDPSWSRDAEYVRRRWQLGQVAGAWEASVASQLRNPTAPPRDDFGQPGLPDSTPYESIKIPVLVVAGSDDPLKEPGYAHDFGTRLPHGQIEVLDNCSHCPNIERPEIVRDLLLRFFAEVEAT